MPENEGAAVDTGGTAAVATRKRTTYTDAQKKDVVREAIKAGNASKVAHEKGIAINLLYRWMNAFRDEVQGEEVKPEPTGAILPAGSMESIRSQIKEHEEAIKTLKLQLADLMLAG